MLCLKVCSSCIGDSWIPLLVVVGAQQLAPQEMIGPFSQAVTNTMPWVTTVASATIDRAFPTAIMLGNNHTLLVLE